MSNIKENPRYNVLSIRITDEEKAMFDEMKNHTRKSVSMLMREAIQMYNHQIRNSINER